MPTKKKTSKLSGLISGGKKKNTNKKKLFFGALAALAVLAIGGFVGKYFWKSHEYSTAKASAGAWTYLYDSSFQSTYQGAGVLTCRPADRYATVRVLVVRSDGRALRSNITWNEWGSKTKHSTPPVADWLGNLQLSKVAMTHTAQYSVNVRFSNGSLHTWYQMANGWYPQPNLVATCP